MKINQIVKTKTNRSKDSVGNHKNNCNDKSNNKNNIITKIKSLFKSNKKTPLISYISENFCSQNVPVLLQMQMLKILVIKLLALPL